MESKEIDADRKLGIWGGDGWRKDGGEEGSEEE